MARIDALSIELQTSGKDKLAEAYGKVVENIQAITLSAKLKNKDLSGDPTSGTVEAKRFVNAQGQAYGTARSAGKGNAIKVKPVIVAIDDNTEYIEEVEEKDLRTYGVDGLISRRTTNHQNALAVELDTKFFAEAKTAGSKFTTTKNDVAEELEEAIQHIETTKNDFVQGVPRNMIEVVLSPAYYGAIRTKVNAVANSQGLVGMANYEEGIFNNAKVYSSAFLPAGVDYIVMVNGAIAQPVMTSVSEPAKIQLSDATGFGLFAYKGTKAVMEDLIIYKEA